MSMVVWKCLAAYRSLYKTFLTIFDFISVPLLTPRHFNFCSFQFNSRGELYLEENGPPYLSPRYYAFEILP